MRDPLLNEFQQLEAEPSKPHRRGRAFEDLIARLFRAAHFDVRVDPHAAAPRQTDLIATLGTSAYLVEAKWRKATTTVADVAALFDRLDRLPSSMVGILISVSGHSISALEMIEKDRHRGLIVPLDGAEIARLLSAPLDTRHTLRRKALGEHLRLQELHNERSQELGQIKAQLSQIREFDEQLANLRLKRDQNTIAAREDFQERRPQWSRAVEIFGANTAELYESPGELAISVSDSGGLKFGVDIERGASQGVQEMMVFCFDLMLAELWADRDPSPGFLVHDSTIFDGVDERQVARSLALAERKSRECGFQYICCLNSDTVPWDELREDFEFRESVRLELSDEGEDGGLFGFRF